MLNRHPALRRALTIVPLLACTLLSAGMTGQAAAAPTPNYTLAVSTQPDRSSAQSLSGRSYAQSSKIHAFTTPSTSVRRVRFYLDDTSMARARAADLEVAAWTVRRRPTFARLARLGVVAVCVEAAALDG